MKIYEKMSIRTLLKLSALVFLVSVLTVGCDDDDSDGPDFTERSKTYTLNSASDPAISGTVKFTERSDMAIVIMIELDGTTSGKSHPAHIHANSVVETGGIIIGLNPVDGNTGVSETVVTEMDNGTAISYDELLDLDGYVNVHLSDADLATIIAQGDIGKNELTTTLTTYSLTSANDSGITGTVTFTKRVSGFALVMVELAGTSLTGEYPVNIYENDMVTTGPVAIDLNNINGVTGLSFTSVKQLNSGTAITYDQLVDFNGHINVSASPMDLTTYVAQANIGANHIGN